MAASNQDPTTGMYTASPGIAVNLVSASKFLSASNAGFLTADGRPRDSSVLPCNQRSGVFGGVVEAVANRPTALTKFMQWAAADPSGAHELTFGLGTLGQITSDTLSLNADPRLAVSYPTATGGTLNPAELPFALNYESLEDMAFGCAALGVKIFINGFPGDYYDYNPLQLELY